MRSTSDPNSQASFLQQCLSSDKRPIGILVGAGCPMAIMKSADAKSPLIQDIAGITKSVQEELKKCPECGPLLEKIAKHFLVDGREDINIEDMLSHVRALRIVAGRDTARGLSAQELDKLDAKMCEIIYDLVNKELPSLDTPYHSMAQWISAINRENPVEIFTTNYDLLLEQAFDDCRVPYFDGFAGSRRPFFDIRATEEDPLPSRWARLWKLHGSINWYQDSKRGVIRSAQTESRMRRVIHPSHLKYDESRRMPYLAMQDRFRAFLKKPSAVLITCGYSFRDEHINEIIIQGLESAPTAITFALLFGCLSGYSEATKLAAERSNLSLLAEDAAIISCNSFKWLEKEKDAITEQENCCVKWQPTDPKDEQSKYSASFLIGDFSFLGSFFHNLVGQEPRMLETPSGE